MLKTVDPIFTNNPAIYIGTCTDKSNRAEYLMDCAFFDAHRDRHYYVRQAGMNEFTEIEDVSEWLQLPMQTTLVCQLCPGIHLCAFVYYGKKHRDVVAKTDTDMAQILSRMLREQGRDRAEWDAFVTQVDQNTVALIEAMNSNANQKAN